MGPQTGLRAIVSPQEGCHCYRSRPILFRGKCSCRAWLVAALDETEELLLVGKLSTQMKAYTLRVAVLQPVTELLVVAEVETLLVKLPLRVPVKPRQ